MNEIEKMMVTFEESEEHCDEKPLDKMSGVDGECKIDSDLKKIDNRMYVFVERHLSPLDKGIQSAHAVVEYANLFGEEEEYKLWSRENKTLILLNGGVVSDLEKIANDLFEDEIKFSVFKEPDMNNIITSVAVLVDEKVYNKKDYPDFSIWRDKKYPIRPMHAMYCTGDFDVDPNDFTYSKHYSEWLENVIGDKKNAMLRELITSKRLA